MSSNIISILIGYLFGSFPTAYTFVKLKFQKDIRKEGSGNVGTMNTFEVTNSKFLGIAVLIIDMLKGVVPILIVNILFGPDFFISALAGISAIIGHCFPVWLNFKGGRGLATTAGVMLVLGWIFILIWLAIWAILYLVSKKIHYANIFSTLLAPFVILFIPESAIRFSSARYADITGFGLFSFIICVLILLGHRDQLKMMLTRKVSLNA